MFESWSRIAKENGLKLKIMILPDKIRAFILEIENSTYIVINDKLSGKKKTKHFRHEMLHYKLGHLDNYDVNKIKEYEKEVDKLMNEEV